MTQAKPWYREPWPWLLMAGPAIVVVAGAITTVIAVRTSDPLVADDYYKQGLAVNRVLARESAAESMGVQAVLQVNALGDRFRVLVRSEAPLPDALQLSLVHPTRAGDDRLVVLEREAPGIYSGALPPLKGTTYQFHLQDAAGKWRYSGRWQAGT
jgi:uncharacterized protein